MEKQIDIRAYIENAVDFQPKKKEYPEKEIKKKEDIENKIIYVYDYQKIVRENEIKSFYVFDCIDENEVPFSFFGSNILANQISDNILPIKTKLIKVQTKNNLAGYYWSFSRP